MNKLITFFIVFFASLNLVGQNKTPLINNIRYNVINGKVSVLYDLYDIDNDKIEILCKIWSNGNLNRYNEILPSNINGDIGYPISPGLNNRIEIDLFGLIDPKIVVQLIALDRESIDIPSIIAEVSKDSLRTHLSRLQGRRNSGDLSFYNYSRKYIEENFRAYYETQSIQTPFGSLNNINIIGNRWGFQTPGNIFINDAHYDSFGQAPGADDNASGVAGMLEIARILGPYASQNSFRLIAFDLEEQGLVGSNIYVNSLRNTNDKVKGVINFEMIGYYSDLENTQDLPTGFNLLFPDVYNHVINNQRRGDFITNVANTMSSSLKNSFDSQAKIYVPDLKVISLEVPGNGSIAPDLTRSDHASFWRENIPALMITDGANFRNKFYHTIRDSMHHLNIDFMASVVKASIATLIQECGFVHGNSKELQIDLSVGVQDEISSPFVTFQNRILSLHGELSDITAFRLYNIHGELVLVKILSNNQSKEILLSNGRIPTGIYIANLIGINKHYNIKIYVQ